jgi:hypothetical protein
MYEMTDVDLGPCRGRVYDRRSDRWAVVLPGANYLPDAPLLWFAREGAVSAGRNVLAVWDTFDGTSDAMRWVTDRLEAALRHVGDKAQPLLIAKSLTTLATGLAAEKSLPAVWLTPLLNSSSPFASVVVDGLRGATAASLLIGGTADRSWDGSVARSIAEARVVEIPDADHALQVAGDLNRSLEALRTVAEAIAEFARQPEEAP